MAHIHVHVCVCVVQLFYKIYLTAIELNLMLQLKMYVSSVCGQVLWAAKQTNFN